MDIQRFKEVSSRHGARQYVTRNACFAFLSGGLLSVVFQGVAFFMMKYFSEQEANTITLLLLIFLAALLTGIGMYDDCAKYCGAGLFIPISGFANALTSSALECKHEGFIYGIGSNMFKLAGSVITYGVVSAILFSAIRYGISLL